jgi:RHH-type proline utilization regulon transcriptional repressor/proline dehydrogenase/delta 1-pyrroline-5-carboxylate dehydrogenase
MRPAGGVVDGPGISVKLSAIHPRYVRSQRERVIAELAPRLLDLTKLARDYDIALNIDAEEADRLELSLDMIETLARARELAGWNGIGFVVQAYQKRARDVIDWLVALARETGHRFMVRLVKGAYWDTEIKRAQVDGMPDYPVLTRKVHTDVSYLACAKAMLAAPGAVYPQFATHNAHTVAAIRTMAGDSEFEYQCLHGMARRCTTRSSAIRNGAARADLCAGRLARDVARVPRAPAARERRELVVRQPGLVDPDVSIESLVADPIACSDRRQTARRIRDCRCRPSCIPTG